MRNHFKLDVFAQVCLLWLDAGRWEAGVAVAVS